MHNTWPFPRGRSFPSWSILLSQFYEQSVRVPMARHICVFSISKWQSHAGYIDCVWVYNPPGPDAIQGFGPEICVGICHRLIHSSFAMQQHRNRSIRCWLRLGICVVPALFMELITKFHITWFIQLPKYAHIGSSCCCGSFLSFIISFINVFTYSRYSKYIYNLFVLSSLALRVHPN